MRTPERAPTGIPRPVLACEDDQYRTLMVRYQAGDAQAFTTLYARLTPGLAAYLDALAPGLGGDADLVDEVFLAIHDARRSYSPRCSFGAWVAAIARHVALERHPPRGAPFKCLLRWRREAVRRPSTRGRLSMRL
jgi:hypothetical protein